MACATRRRSAPSRARRRRELSLRRTRVRIAELLDSIATRFRRRGAEAGRTIEIAAPSGLVALVDRRRLEQALANLVENAIRHGSGTVGLEAVEVTAAIVLHVSDEGQGFPPQFLERAFERFSRADGSRAGAELGLATWPQSRTLTGAPHKASNHRTGAPTWR